ncbi:cytochrome c oxidase subunit II [Hyphomicrobium methylovorum]|uniref:cytochrome c oxidase subunit II n=1 Tax=Hyphomicrobium methylovorum TaxID=84 RepID=UPI0015E6C371|nr:cytochrome c oxidase subunit II [Hyphomicrobium methylovorum]MBA2125839.1 cytochrome c oxidase subunit II [Hyphomicrobium methylovorum]
MFKRLLGAVLGLTAACSAMAFVGLAPALAGFGHPTDGELGLQGAATPLMEELTHVHDTVNYIIISIAVFVIILMGYVMFRFSAKNNPTPSRTTHHTGLEVAWTIVPILILVGISIPSFHLLFNQYAFPKPDLTVKVTGNSWFWDTEYLDQNISITSNIINDEDLIRAKVGDEAYDQKYGALEGARLHAALYTDSLPLWAETHKRRRLSVDQEIAVPVNKNVHVLVTSSDVIHSWTVPSFGVKMQAVPGRTSAVWFRATRIGTYTGQCSVLCGKLHSAMPIVVRVVDQTVYDAWLAAMQGKDKKKAQKILDDDVASRGDQSNVASAQ